jgi:hypothetical protein
MILVLQDGDNKMVLNIGIFVIHGVVIGVRMEILDLLEVLII